MQVLRSKPLVGDAAAAGPRAAPRRPAGRVSVKPAQAAPRLPPDTPKEREGGREWLATILSRFGPVKEKAQTVTTLEFEKPLLELDKRIKEVRTSVERTPDPGQRSQVAKLAVWAGPQVRKVAEENGVDVTASIAELETRARQVSCRRI